MSLINCYRLVSILLTTIAVLGFATPKAQASLLVASNATNSVLEYCKRLSLQHKILLIMFVLTSVLTVIKNYNYFLTFYLCIA